MSLALTALPDYREQIAGLERLVEERNRRIAQLEADLRRAEAERAAVQAGIAELRRSLEPLHHALNLIFGNIDANLPPGEDRREASAAKREVWESWKQKLGGLTAKAIDVLRMHGAMNQAQLRIQLSCATRSVTNVVAALNKAGLIDKAGGKISLKELP